MSKARPKVTPQLLTVRQFCMRNNIPEWTYYRMRNQGIGPREMNLGGIIRISLDAEAAWRKQCEARSAEARSRKGKVANA